MVFPLPVSVLIMAGGRGTRMQNASKPLLPVGGKTLLERIVRIARVMSPHVYVCASPHARDVASHARSMGIGVVEGYGRDYTSDLSLCLSSIRERPAVILPADILVTDEKAFEEAVVLAMQYETHISTVLQQGEFVGVSVCNADFASTDEWSFISIEVPGRFCINVNTPDDLQEARRFIEHQ